ncbi:hemerythrin domain-containing protein [Microbispora sp. NBC_01189]|uniref:hemerythrin domain-containing protein n=1 Tax=Microbispora sp. NBC_01189 TaxID=2903583 RepID=UPI002E0D71C5|nr:hemerythrin domain-containing protein [Microbispora sp. NBC_01189]
MDRQTRPETMRENDVIDLLIQQHALIRELFDEVDRCRGKERKEAFSRLARMLAVHETAEEEIVHPYARRKLVGGDAIVDNRLQEEEEAKELLCCLDEMDATAPGFTQELERLRAAVFAHAAAEERYEFSELKACTSEGQRRAMAVGVRAAEAVAPTHPHPGVTSPAENILMGPPLAIMDRARDLIRKAMGKPESGEG